MKSKLYQRSLWCFVLCWAVCGAAAGGEVVCRAVRKPPVLDGELADAAWAKDGWVSGFSVLNMPGSQAEAQTRFQVVSDGTDLYVAAELAEPRVGDIRAKETKRDGRVHSDDCFEIFLDPQGDRTDYYHFAVNAAGVLGDAEVRQGGGMATKEWNCAWQAATRIGAGSWTVEARIPLAELGLTRESLGAWGFNVARERKGAKKELSSFVPLNGGFHQPTLFAALRLEGVDLARYLWKIQDPFDVRTVRENECVFHVAKTVLENQTGEFRFFDLVPALVHGTEISRGEPIPDGLDAGQRREYALRIPVVTEGDQMLEVRVRDRGRDGRPHAVKKVPVNASYQPIDVILTRPWYRDNIYATESLDSLAMTVTLGLAPDRLRGMSLRAVFRREGDPKPIARTEQAGPGASNTLVLPVPELAVGRYELAVQLLDASGTAVHEKSKTVRRLAPVAHEWRLVEGGVLLHNGEPYLPFGWFSESLHVMAAPDCPYTAMQRYGAEWLSDEKMREYLDKVAAAGTYVLMGPYPSRAMTDHGSGVWGKPLSDKEAEALRARVRALKDHPGLLGWYIADEPELRPALPERTRRICAVIAEEDPYHPCIMLNDTIAGIYRYVDGGDVLMPDPYPQFIKGGMAGKDIAKVGQFIQACADAGKGRKGVWITPQAFNNSDYGHKNQRIPNFTELRNMTYQAVAYGAKGFLWFTAGGRPNYPSLSIGMPFLAREIAFLKDAVLAPDVPGALTIEAGRPDHVHVSVRNVRGTAAIVMVNTATKAQQVRFKWASRPDSGTLHVVSEARQLTPGADGTYRDEFAPYAVHIYMSRPVRTGLPTIGSVQAQIEKADAARKKPGNLAFEDSGVEVAVSSKKSRSWERHNRVVNGVVGGYGWKDKTRNEYPDWLTLTWPEPVTAGRVAVYSRSIGAAEIEARANGQWKTVGRLRAKESADRDAPLTAAFTPVRTDSLRVWVTAGRKGKDQTEISEIEVYAK